MIESEVRAEALRLLRLAVEKSKREKQVPFAKDFLRSAGGRPPLAQMIHGGQGGEVRLRLYLTITMMATRQPFDLTTPPAPQRWARMLGVTGSSPARRVSQNLRWLHNNKFIALEPRPGNLPKITVLNPAVPGEPYALPSKQGTPYVSLPLGLWSAGWILELSPTALALLMVIRDVQQARDDARYLTKQDRADYGLSPDTWTRATKELRAYGLLEVKRVPQGGEFDYQRMRNLYRVDLTRLADPPGLVDEHPDETGE
jgi:hypothetical protein